MDLYNLYAYQGDGLPRSDIPSLHAGKCILRGKFTSVAGPEKVIGEYIAAHDDDPSVSVRPVQATSSDDGVVPAGRVRRGAVAERSAERRRERRLWLVCVPAGVAVGGLAEGGEGFEDLGEGVAAGGDGAVWSGAMNLAFEDVGIEAVVWLCGVWGGEGEELAEFGEEELGVGAFGSAGAFPAGDEIIESGKGGLGVWHAAEEMRQRVEGGKGEGGGEDCDVVVESRRRLGDGPVAAVFPGAICGLGVAGWSTSQIHSGFIPGIMASFRHLWTLSGGLVT